VLNCSWVANPWVNGTPTAILVTRLALVKRECQFLTPDHPGRFLAGRPEGIFLSPFEQGEIGTRITPAAL
jgi:hypothetical protein